MKKRGRIWTERRTTVYITIPDDLLVKAIGYEGWAVDTIAPVKMAGDKPGVKLELTKWGWTWARLR